MVGEGEGEGEGDGSFEGSGISGIIFLMRSHEMMRSTAERESDAEVKD